MTTASIIYFGLGAVLGMGIAIIAVLPEYRRHERAISGIVARRKWRDHPSRKEKQ